MKDGSTAVPTVTPRRSFVSVALLLADPKTLTEADCQCDGFRTT